MKSRWRWDIAVGVVVLTDVLRVFLPSLITLFGQAGGTPPEYMGLFALAWFAAPMLVIPLTRVVAARTIMLTGAVVLIAARVLLQVPTGGDLQLYTASIGTAAGLVWLIAASVHSTDTAALTRGFLIGLGLTTIVQAALDGVDLVWRGPIPALPLLLIELGAFGYALTRRPVTTEPVGSGRPLLLWGPALLLWGMYLGNAAHISRDQGRWATVALVVMVALWMLLLARAPVVGRAPRIVAGLALIGAVTYFVVEGLDTTTGPVIVAVTLVALAALAALTSDDDTATATPTPRAGRRRGWATATSMLALLILTFAYYAAFDLYYPNWWVPPVTALLIAVVAIVGAPVATRIRPPRVTLPAVGLLTIAALTAGIAPLWQAASPSFTPPEDGLRVAAYNIRMGFDLDGRLALDRQADILAAQRPHVIALSEVDRGWFLNGGHDDLRRLAERLDMEFLWAPVDGNHWGDALLTNLPVQRVERHRLVPGGPTGAGALEVELRWQDRPVTVISTHLQPPTDWQPLDQAEQLADIVREAAERTPVVVAGDLNLEPDSPPWDVLLAAGLVDPVAADRPFPSIPGDSPQQIDHILVTEEFTVVDAVNPDVPHSDHRPIAMTLRW